MQHYDQQVHIIMALTSGFLSGYGGDLRSVIWRPTILYPFLHTILHILLYMSLHTFLYMILHIPLYTNFFIPIYMYIYLPIDIPSYNTCIPIHWSPAEPFTRPLMHTPYIYTYKLKTKTKLTLPVLSKCDVPLFFSFKFYY